MKQPPINMLHETEIIAIINALEDAAEAAVDDIRSNYGEIMELDSGSERDYRLDAPQRFARILFKMDEIYDAITGVPVSKAAK